MVLFLSWTAAFVSKPRTQMRAMNNLWEGFEAAAAIHAAREALYFADGSLTFAALLERARRVARWLDDHGIRKGDVVALQLPKRRDTYAIWLGCLRHGAL